MKETIKVGIGGYAFTCDADAYEILDNYLNNLKSYFENKSDGNEVINDIEGRMSELLALKGEAPGYIITLADAQDIISIMGKPSDIADEDISDQAKESPSRKKELPPTGKKLYRDADNAIFGGVFSGLGHYFRIDPVILRIIYLAIIFFPWPIFGNHAVGFLGKFSGVFFLAYFILWVVVPKAQTFQQKLAMSGKDSSVDSIASGNVSPGVRGSNAGRVLKAILKIIGGVILFSIVVSCILLVLFLLFFPSLVNLPSVNDFFDTSGMNAPYMIPSILIICFLPIFMIVYAIIRLIKRFMLRDLVILGIAFAIWLGACSYCAFTGINFAKDYKHESTIVEKFIPRTQSDTLNLQLGNQYRVSEALFESNEVFRIENEDIKTWFLVPRINIKRDKDYKDIEIEIKKKAFGKSWQIAEDKANNARFDIKEQGSGIIINPRLYNKNNVWDREGFSITIYCPEDKTIIVDKLLEPRTRGDKHPKKVEQPEEADPEQENYGNEMKKQKNDSTTTVTPEKEI